MTQTEKTQCWEIFDCDESNCPSYHKEDQRCWLVSGTHCHDGVQGDWLEKMEICIDCDMFKHNFSEDDFKLTLNLIAEQFSSYQSRIVEESEKLKSAQKKLQEFKTTSIYLLRELDKKSRELEKEKESLEDRVKDKTREINEMYENLVQSKKMAAVGQFAAGIAHEINNPLGAIINYVRNVMAHPDTQGNNRGYLEQSLKGLFRIENIVKQILSYSGKHKVTLQPVPVAMVLNETLHTVEYKINQKRIHLTRQIKDAAIRVMADTTQLQQVFSNILFNAIDAVDSGGEIAVQAGSKNGAYEIQILDNGQGIPDAVLEQVYDPFFTTKEVGKGTGLGLFLSYNIIESFHGSIQIQSKMKKGTRVTIKLPVIYHE